ncbi:hypothetical protein HK102_005585 [Quaeritorhiza haematococci]|nr:hypothetical protein HK102_005585 [Quaeritorhiza haematococci]
MAPTTSILDLPLETLYQIFVATNSPRTVYSVVPRVCRTFLNALTSVSLPVGLHISLEEGSPRFELKGRELCPPEEGASMRTSDIGTRGPAGTGGADGANIGGLAGEGRPIFSGGFIRMWDSNKVSYYGIIVHVDITVSMIAKLNGQVLRSCVQTAVGNLFGELYPSVSTGVGRLSVNARSLCQLGALQSTDDTNNGNNNTAPAAPVLGSQTPTLGVRSTSHTFSPSDVKRFVEAFDILQPWEVNLLANSKEHLRYCMCLLPTPSVKELSISLHNIAGDLTAEDFGWSSVTCSRSSTAYQRLETLRLELIDDGGVISLFVHKDIFSSIMSQCASTLRRVEFHGNFLYHHGVPCQYAIDALSGSLIKATSLRSIHITAPWMLTVISQDQLASLLLGLPHLEEWHVAAQLQPEFWDLLHDSIRSRVAFHHLQQQLQKNDPNEGSASSDTNELGAAAPAKTKPAQPHLVLRIQNPPHVIGSSSQGSPLSSPLLPTPTLLKASNHLPPPPLSHLRSLATWMPLEPDTLGLFIQGIIYCMPNLKRLTLWLNRNSVQPLTNNVSHEVLMRSFERLVKKSKVESIDVESLPADAVPSATLNIFRGLLKVIFERNHGS